jgi:hypothetical protein
VKIGDVVCIESGYRYSYRGEGRNWKRSSDEMWDTAVGDRVCGKYLGSRRIDGVACAVVRAAGNRTAEYLAATKQSVRLA